MLSDIIGLDIKVKAIHNNFIYKILKNIINKEYKWVIICDQIDVDGKIEQGLFCKNVLLNNEFFNCIINKIYYMIFVDIKVYPINSKIDEINTISDFLKSNCELIFLCTDTSCLEIYSKDKSILKNIFNNCNDENFISIKYVTINEALNRTMVAF